MTRAWLAIALLSLAQAAHAQEGPPDGASSGRFHVAGFAVAGAALLSSEDFTRIIAPYVGRNRSAADVEAARAALQRAYQDMGRCSIRVTLAHPRPLDGVVNFRLHEDDKGGNTDCLPAILPHDGPQTSAAAAAADGPVVSFAYVEKRERALPPINVASRTPVPLPLDADGGAAARVGTPLVAQPQAAPPARAVNSAPPVAQPPRVEVAQAQAAPPAPAPIAQAPRVEVAQAPATPPARVTEAPPVPQAPRFDIVQFTVEGNTLLTKEQIDKGLAPFTGKAKDFGDVQRALDALSELYRGEGYGGVEVRLPEQELDKGIVRLNVIEPKIGRITVEGNQFFSEANLRRSVPALREGETPQSREIGKNIRLANENPAKQSAVVLKAAEREDRIDAAIRVADVDPMRYSVSLDNTGTKETHRERLGIAFQHANVFDRDHVLTAQFITSPLNYHDVAVYGIGYRIPFYSLGDSLDLIAGYSNVNSGTVQGLFTVAGKGAIYAVRYNQHLPRWGDLEHKLTYGLEYRAYQNNVVFINDTNNQVPDITVHPFSLTYSGAWRAEGKGELTYYTSIVQNIPGGNDAGDAQFKQIGVRFPDGKAGYRLYRLGASYSRPIGADWQIRARFDGQYTGDALVSGESFAIGGADSVRGFSERYTSNDRGYRTSWEIYTPDFAKKLNLDGRLRALAFYDQGVVWRNKALPTDLAAASLDSAGLGLRMNYKNNLTLRLDVAYVYHDGAHQSTIDSRRGITKAHFSVAWVF